MGFGLPGTAHVPSPRPRRLAVLAIFGAALAAGVYELPVAVHRVDAEVTGLEASTPLQRELRGARYVGLATDVFVTAERIIPRNAVFLVTVGRAVPGSQDADLNAVRPYAAYWLFPRRETNDPSEADWVVSYGGDLRGVGLRYSRVIHVQPRIAVAEVRR
jgi:hypothetical protein